MLPNAKYINYNNIPYIGINNTPTRLAKYTDIPTIQPAQFNVIKGSKEITTSSNHSTTNGSITSYIRFAIDDFFVGTPPDFLIVTMTDLYNETTYSATLDESGVGLPTLAYTDFSNTKVNLSSISYSTATNQTYTISNILFPIVILRASNIWYQTNLQIGSLQYTPYSETISLTLDWTITTNRVSYESTNRVTVVYRGFNIT